MIVVGFLIAFFLAFGIGANDVANSFGTSVGSRVLTLRQAFILACVFETLGAILLGAKVSDTIRKGIIDLTPYENNTSLLMVGNVAALAGSCVWLIAATLLRLPVSATHSIVGATVGFALVAHGAKGIRWDKLGMIIGSWFISPILAGGVSIGLFFICHFFILNKDDQLEPGLRFLPIFYAVTIVVNLFSVFYEGPEMLGFNKIPLWGTFIISFGCGVICAIVIRMFVVPWQRKRIRAQVFSVTQSVSSVSQDLTPADSTSHSIIDEGLSRPTEKLTGECLNGKHSNGQVKKATNAELYGNQTNELLLFTEKPPCQEKKKGSVKQNLSQVQLVNEESHSGFATPIGINSAPTDLTNLETVFRNGECVENSVENGAVNGMRSIGGIIVRTPSSCHHSDHSDTTTELTETSSREQGRLMVIDRPEACQLFSFLQILTAVFGAFAHGGNDVSNAIGPLISLWLIGTTQTVATMAPTPIWILLFGGIGISLGLCILGRRVIKTLGEDLTRITPSSGFCIEIGSALTVLIASNIGVPISTTHCKVGSVVFVGRFRARENVDWSIFRNIVLAWLVTLPVTGGISAAIMAGLRLTVPQE